MRIEDLKYTTLKNVQKNILKDLYNEAQEYKKNKTIKLFAYSHLKNPDNIKKIINRKPILTNRIIEGFKKYRDSNDKIVIKKDKDSKVEGKVFNVDNAEYKKISNKMKPYKSKMIDKKEKLISFYKQGAKLNKLGTTNSLWNNIRANKGSGKEPTKEMLEQERKIKLKKYESGSKLNNDKAMVNGVADILSQVKDISNRKQMTKNILKKFKDENVTFDKSKFLDKVK